MIKRLLRNAVADVCTSALGTLAGGTDLIDGIANHDTAKIIKGVSLILLGLITNSKDK
jgi:hypothetical protein